MSRAVRTLATALACLGAAASGFAARTSLLVLTATDRFEVPAQPRGRADWVALRALGDKLRLNPRAEGSSLRLTWGDRELVVSDRKNVASTAGQMTLLSAPCTFEAGDWWVPADSLEPLFGPLLQISVRYRPAQRALLLGNPPVPRVTIGQMVTPDGVDITLDASSPVAFHMTRPEDSVVVSFGDAVVDVDMRASSASTGDILEAVRLVQGTETSLVMTLGPRFLDVRASEPDAGRRLVLNFSASAVEPGPVADAVPARPAGAGLRTIVIDPGHGGADSGALGPGGVTEKAIVLRFAQQLRASLTSGLGLQVVLTREKDEDVELDARPGIANNFKAQLFVSLHAGSRQSGGWPGPRVLHRLDHRGDPAADAAAGCRARDLVSGAGAEPGDRRAARGRAADAARERHGPGPAGAARGGAAGAGRRRDAGRAHRTRLPRRPEGRGAPRQRCRPAGRDLGAGGRAVTLLTGGAPAVNESEPRGRTLVTAAALLALFLLDHLVGALLVGAAAHAGRRRRTPASTTRRPNPRPPQAPRPPRASSFSRRPATARAC